MSKLIPLNEFIKVMDESGYIDSIQLTMDNRQFQFVNIIPYINHHFGTDLRLFTSACPVQIVGSIDGHTVYFRARWSSSELLIGGWENPIFHMVWKDAVLSGSSWLAPEIVGQYLYTGLSEYRENVRQAE